MTTSVSQPPFTTALTQGAFVTSGWLRWVQELWQGVTRSCQQIGLVSLTAQTASIGATAVPTPALTTGRYLVRWYTRVTTPGTVSSSLMVTIGWTDGAVAQTTSGATLTANTTTTQESGSILVTADAATTITYATTYASAGATAMAYALTVTVDAVP